MLPKVINVSSITKQKIHGRVTSWQTPNGPFNVEHLAGASPHGECLVFYWSPQHDWQVVNVSQKTGHHIAGHLTSWQTPNGPYNVEHLAGRSPNDDLLVFYWSPQHDWQVVNVSQKTGHKIAGAVTSWQTPNGPYNVEHLAGRAPNGDLLVFYWSPQHDWQVVNVSQKTRQRIASDVTSWVVPNGPMLVEHLAGHDSEGSLHVFWWSPAHDWQTINVSSMTGRKIAGSPTSWVTPSAGHLVEHLGARSSDGSLLVFYWTPSTNWQVVNASDITGQKIAGNITVYQLPDGTENVEVVGARTHDGALVLHWWKPSRDWQAINWSDAVGPRHLIKSSPEAWLTPNGRQTIEHLAAAGTDGSLLVYYGDEESRHITDVVGGPFQELVRTRGVRRKLAAILWDPHRTTDPAPTLSAVENILFGPTNSVRDYYLQNSNGYYTIEKAAVLGWYDADKPASYYWGPVDTNDLDGDGWVNPHVEKWAEAIRKAGPDFNFQPFDNNPMDGSLDPSELGILIVIPQNNPFGSNRGAVGREYPQPQPLVVDGVRFGTIAEVYIGAPVNLGVCAHELCHLFLHGPDLYFDQFPMPYAAGAYSLMDGTYQGTHLDPFEKLKFGWLRPKVILRSGSYTLADIETRHDVLILMDPRRSLDEYFIIENRWPGTSYDMAMPQTGGGLGVWHIMENPMVYGTVAPPPGVSASNWAMVATNDWGRRGIQMIRPVFGPGIYDTQALWDGADPATGYNLEFSDPNPAHATLHWADGTPSGFALRSIPPAAPDATVTIEVPF